MTSTMNAVNQGFNKFCGPAVLSILTGKSTDECASVIGGINGKYDIEGVSLPHLLDAARKLGFDVEAKDTGLSLYRTLVQISLDNGMYIVTLPKHFVCIEVKDRNVFFCDNHTKVPIPAGSSARLMQKVMAIHKVTERPRPIKLEEYLVVLKLKSESNWYEIKIYRHVIYNVPEANLRLLVGSFRVENESEIESIANQLKLRR